jgi:signal peptidase I
LPSLPPKPSLYAVPGGVLALSGEALKEFLQAVLAKGASFRFKARGVSMHPFIKDGEVVTVSPVQVDQLSPGDIVAFCQSETGKLVVHRILKKNSQGFLLQGDNCPATDGLIPAASIVGRVTAVGETRQLVRLGQGPERFFLALLSRHHLLQPLLCRIRQALSPFLPRAKGKA